MSTAVISASTPILQTTKEEQFIRFDELLKKIPDDHYYPKTIMRKLLDKYSIEDLQKIYADFLVIRANTFRTAEKGRSYTVTAGAPAAGKSSLLEKMIGYDVTTGTNSKGFAYIDPDRAAMIQMPSYKEDRRLHDEKKEGRDAKAAYEHWREASNFIAQVLLAEALVEGYKIAHGTTMSVDQSITNLQAIQTKYGYTTRLIHCTTSDEIRLGRERLRQTDDMYQVTPEDFASKSVKFFSLLPKYVSATSIDFYCSKDVTHTDLAATKELNQKSIIVNQELFDQIISLHKSKGVENPAQYF